MSLSLHLLVVEEDLGNQVLHQLKLVMVVLVVVQVDIMAPRLVDRVHTQVLHKIHNLIGKDMMVVMQYQDIQHHTLVAVAVVPVVPVLILKMMG